MTMRRAYPPFKGKDFSSVSNPESFTSGNERLGWGFFGHRHALYTAAVPHVGYEIARRWCADKAHGYQVFTSNVDGAFFEAGFAEDRVVECHGSIRHLQCVDPYRCEGRHVDGADQWWHDDAEGSQMRRFTVDEETFLAKGPLPKCKFCGGLARPNICEVVLHARWASSV